MEYIESLLKGYNTTSARLPLPAHYQIFGYYVDQLHYIKILQRLESQQFDEVVRVVFEYADLSSLNTTIRRISYVDVCSVVETGVSKSQPDSGAVTVATDTVKKVEPFTI
jgi:hypothetical protein